MTPPPPDVSDFLRKLVFKASALVLDEKKDYLLHARLSPIVEKEGGCWNELVRRLSSPAGGNLRQRVVDALATHETSFFRDVHPFDALQAHVLPRLAEESQKRAVNLWSAASSSGQEAYSIALLLAQQPGMDQRRVRVLGTDLSAEILVKAREGRYSQLEINRGLPARMLLRLAERADGNDWRVREEIRRLVDFRVMNLAEAWPHMPEMDVVFLRNVLIYFDVPTKRAVLERVAKVLRPDGLLFLGAAETTLNLSERFVPTRFGKAACWQKKE